MEPYHSLHFGNPASRQHRYGRKAADAVDLARREVSGLIGADPHEIIFTAGATEAINLTLYGLYMANRQQRSHIITVATEHPAVTDTCRFLASLGARITWLPVDGDGLILWKEFEESIDADTLAVCVMYGNNETGCLQPVRAIADRIAGRDIFLLTDATQAAGKVRVNELGADLLAMSAHKMYGPKGAGALYIRKKEPRLMLEPLIRGGGHEKGLRSGTLNVPAIVGFGKACTLAADSMDKEQQLIAELRDGLERQLQAIPGFVVNGSGAPRLPNTSNVAIKGLEATLLLESLGDKLCLATGSACASGNAGPSPVLKAMGYTPERLQSSFRISLGRSNTREEIEFAGQTIREHAELLR